MHEPLDPAWTGHSSAVHPHRKIEENRRSEIYAPENVIDDFGRTLSLRARELFHTDKEFFQERQAVDAATHALRALRSTLTRKKSGDRIGRSQAA